MNMIVTVAYFPWLYRTPDIPRKCLIPTTGFLSGCHLVKFVRMVLGLPKIFEILSGWMDLGFFWPGFVRIGLPGAQKPPERL